MIYLCEILQIVAYHTQSLRPTQFDGCTSALPAKRYIAFASKTEYGRCAAAVPSTTVLAFGRAKKKIQNGKRIKNGAGWGEQSAADTRNRTRRSRD